MATNAETKFYFHKTVDESSSNSTTDFYYELKVSGHEISDLLVAINKNHTEKAIAEKLGYSRGYIAVIKQGKRKSSMTSKSYNEFMTRIKQHYPTYVSSEYDLNSFDTWAKGALEEGLRNLGASVWSDAKTSSWSIETSEGTMQSGIKFVNKTGKQYIAYRSSSSHTGDFKQTSMDDFP